MKITDKSSLFSRHFIALSILFVLGNAVIGLPKENANKFTFLGFLISFIIGNILYFLIFLIKREKILLILGFLVSFWAAADTFLDFLNFINKTLLRETPRILILIPLVFAVVLFALKSKTALFKFSLISAVFSVLAIIFFFIFTAKDFEIKNIIIKTVPTMKEVWLQTVPYIKTVTLPSLLLVIFAKITKITKGSTFSGFFLGNAVLAACILNSVLLFGSEFSGRLDYPYASAISTVTFGSLFTRMDGFAYFIYFVSCVVKITVSIEIIKKYLRNAQ